MSYAALGASYTISTPWGNKTISIPIEDMARDAANMAFDAAWPPLRERLSGEIPGLIDEGMSAAQSRLQQVLPGLVNQGMSMAQQRLEQALPSLMDQMVQEVQPDLRAEIDRAIRIGTSRLVLGATILGAVIAGSTFIILRSRRKG